MCRARESSTCSKVSGRKCSVRLLSGRFPSPIRGGPDEGALRQLAVGRGRADRTALRSRATVVSGVWAKSEAGKHPQRNNEAARCRRGKDTPTDHASKNTAKPVAVALAAWVVRLSAVLRGSCRVRERDKRRSWRSRSALKQKRIKSNQANCDALCCQALRREAFATCKNGWNPSVRRSSWPEATFHPSIENLLHHCPAGVEPR